MNIAFYIPLLNVGGAEKVIINLLKELAKSDNNNYFLVTDTHNSSWIDELDTRIKKLNVNSNTNILSRIFALKDQIKVNKIDLLVSHLTHANIHSLLIKRLIGIKLIIVEHNITSDYINDLSRSKKIFNFIIRNYFSYADKIVCVSKATQNDLVSYFNIVESKCEVIYNPFDFDNIKILSKKPLREDINKFINHRKFFVTVARLEIQKNHLFLIESLSDFLKSKNVVLILIGGGSQMDIIKRKIDEMDLQNHVLLAGYESNPYPYIEQADILVHPARFEGFGLVLVEAIFLNTQVITMNFATAYEILENEQMGYIVSDKLTLQKAVEVALNRELPEQLEAKIKNRFAIEIIANQYLKCFEEILQ